MNCVSYCLLATALLVSTIVIMLTCKYDSSFKIFANSLNKMQTKKYSSIFNERLRIYIQGVILGVLSGLLVVVLVKKLQRYSKICLFVLMILIISSVYYKLVPKSDYMIRWLTSQTQIDNWLRIYTTIKFRGTLALVLSVVAYILLGFACC